MLRLLAKWILSAVSLLIATRVIPGFHVSDMRVALVAALGIVLVG